MPVFIFQNRVGQRRRVSAQCAASVQDQQSMNFHQCFSAPVVHRNVEFNGSLRTFGFCKKHDPVAVAQREKDRNERYEKLWKKRSANYDYQDKLRAATKHARRALETIAEGFFGDASLIAERALKKFPKEPSDAS